MHRLLILPMLIVSSAYLIFSVVESLNAYKSNIWIYIFFFGFTAHVMLSFFNYILKLRINGQAKKALNLFSYWKYFLSNDAYWLTYFEILLEDQNISEVQRLYFNIEKDNTISKWLIHYIRFNIKKSEKNFETAENAIKEALAAKHPESYNVSMTGDYAMFLIENFPDRANEALEMLNSTLKKQSNSSIKIVINGLIGCTKVTLKDFSLAKDILEKSIKETQKVAKKNVLFKAYLALMYKFLGIAYYNLSNKEKAKDCFDKGLKQTGLKEINEKIKEELYKIS